MRGKRETVRIIASMHPHAWFAARCRDQIIPPGSPEAGPVKTALLTGGPVATNGGLLPLSLSRPGATLFIGGACRFMTPLPFDLHRGCLSAPLRSSSLAENELCPSLRSSVDGVFDGERGRCGELRLTAPSSGPPPLRPRKLPTPPLVPDVSRLRIGLSGGRGGAVRPVLLSARDLGPL